MLVYVIQSDGGLDSGELENCYATLNKEVAKQLIIDEVLSSECDEIPNKQEVEEFAQDLVDGNTEHLWCNRFEGISVWCDILELQEKIETESKISY